MGGLFVPATGAESIKLFIAGSSKVYIFPPRCGSHEDLAFIANDIAANRSHETELALFPGQWLQV
jgi:hypothetical protein